jgi:molecular chaperone GrpE
MKSQKTKRQSVKSVNKPAESVLLRNQLARALADYDNLRKRVEVERETWIAFSSERILIKIIPILDALESAQEHLKDQGLAIAIGEFKNVLEEEDIEEIKPKVGDKFNENIHEAVEAVGDGQKGYIAELVLTGWKFKASGPEGKVIRYAKVKVYGEDIPKGEKKEELEKEMARGDYM